MGMRSSPEGDRKALYSLVRWFTKRTGDMVYMFKV